MNLRVMRKLVIPGIAVGAIMAGAPAALAATPSSAAMPARAVTNADTPALGPWTYYSNYPTHAACNGAGDWLEIHKNIYDFECVEMELDGYTTVWDLYFRII
jgi:hypothetical protein